MPRDLRELTKDFSVKRIKKTTLEMLEIESVTGNSDEMAIYIAERFSKLGIDAEVDGFEPGIPNVRAVIKGCCKKSLSLLGHMDTIAAYGNPAPYEEDGVIYGRGACDMKGGLAAMLEIARVISEGGGGVSGELIFAFHSAHEIPGRAEGLFRMLDKKLLGEAVICMEGPGDLLVLHGKGMGNYTITVRQKNPPRHEVESGGLTNPIVHMAGIVNTFCELNDKWAPEPYKDLGGQSLFIGELNSGDYYNRMPADCVMKGTVRFNPGKTFEEITAEIDGILEDFKKPGDITIERGINFVGRGYSVDAGEPVVQALRAGYMRVAGKVLPEGGMMQIGDASKVVNYGKIPAVYFGPSLDSAHSAREKVLVSEIEKQCRVVLAAAGEYFNKTF